MAMGAPGWTALLLALLLRGRDCSGTSSHSARYFLTAVSEPGHGLPLFTAVAYINDQLIGYYDSRRGKIVSPVDWVQKIEKEDPQLWVIHLLMAQYKELSQREHLASVQSLHNQSAGFHTLQFLSGCDLSKSGQNRGLAQLAYDGRDFIAFDKETLTWTAASAKAEVTKRKWDANLPRSQRQKTYLEETCIEWLQKYLEFGKEALLRKVPPEVKVTHKDGQEDLDTLLCQAHGFYPKEIDITWRKDGEVRQEDTFHGVVSPNSDGTYYTWHSIEIDRKDRSRYQCHVEHDGLQDPLDVAVEESVPVWIIVVGVILGVLVILAVPGVILYIRKR